MSLVLVLTVVSLALAEAGYQYNTPSVSFGQPSNPPANLQPGDTLQHHAALPNLYDKLLTHSISYKDYVYLKQDTNNGGFVATPDKQATAGPSLNSGEVNRGYAPSFVPAPIVNSDNNHAQTSAPVNTNFNSGLIQNFLPITKGNINSGSNSNFAHASGSLNTGYAQSPPISAATHLNNGDSLSINQNQGNPQTPILLNKQNNGYLQILIPYTSSSTASNSKAQTSITSSDLHTQYSQTLQPSGFSIPSTVSHTNNFYTGYSQSLLFGITSTSNGLETINANGNLNNAYTPSDGTTVSYSLDNGIPQIPTNSFNVNPNPTPSFDASVSNGNIQSSPGSANSNIVFTQTSSSNNFNGNSNPAAAFKHVYFHVPPPDVEDQKTLPLPPLPKKNYKILFIKVPSQDPRKNLATLKHIAEMSIAAASVEHKTLVYVLVKNPETPEPVVIPKRTTSEHEVFFVKYNGNPLDIAAEVNDELEKSGTVQSIVPLQPGLVNGNK